MSDLSLVLFIALLIALAIGYGLWRQSQRAIGQLRRERLELAREQAAARQRVKQTEAQLAAFGLAMLEAIVVVDGDLRVMYASPGAQALFGAGDKVAGRSLIDLTRSNELDQLAVDALAIEPGSPGVRDDLDRQMLIAGRPFRARAAAFGDGAVLALSDISELQRLGRARREFVANISHELRTPLTSIRLLLDSLLAGSAGDPAEMTGLLQKIQVFASPFLLLTAPASSQSQ